MAGFTFALVRKSLKPAPIMPKGLDSCLLIVQPSFDLDLDLDLDFDFEVKNPPRSPRLRVRCMKAPPSMMLSGAFE